MARKEKITVYKEETNFEEYEEKPRDLFEGDQKDLETERRL